MTAGRVLYLVWHRPIGALKRSIREGGPIEQWKTERGRRMMEQAAWQLGRWGAGKGDGRSPQPLHAGGWATAAPSEMGDGGALKGESENRKAEFENKAKTFGLKPLELHMVVGKRFWYMAAFAVVSLLKQLDRGLVVHFYSDGSLTKEQAEALARLPIQTKFHSAEEIRTRVDKGLPKERFPNLRERFDNYPNIQKLISPHVGSYGPKIVLDADVLFFRRPDELLAWQEDPKGVLCATDIVESYGYPREELERLAGGRLPSLVNVGITGLVSEQIEWEMLEKWCAELHTKHGTSYYLEQALIAMMSVKNSCLQLEKNNYITYPNEAQMRERVGTMQHYVDLSKKWYFRENWRRVLLD